MRCSMNLVSRRRSFKGRIKLTSNSLHVVLVVTVLGLAVLLVSVLLRTDNVSSSLTLTLDLPAGLSDKNILTQLYIHQLQKQLRKKEYKEIIPSVYAERRRHLRNECSLLQEKKYANQLFTENKTEMLQKSQVVNQLLTKNNMWMLQEPPLFFCPSYKTGTTFWGKTMEVLRRKDPNICSPFQVFDNYALQKQYLWSSEMLMNASKYKDINKILEEPLKFLFVRNPFHRLFSVYVDKLLAPNPFFWDFGAVAKYKFREGYARGSAQFPGDPTCGHDITFDEFIKMVLIYRKDRHLKPISTLCEVCQVRYDIVGKLETFEQDVRYILQKTGSLGNAIQFKDFQIETAVDTILYQVQRAFMLQEEWRRCLTKHTGMKRLWRQLQISGLIDKHDGYYLTSSESEKVAVAEYINMALEAFQRSSNHAKENKHEAYLQAYSQLSIENLDQLRMVYLNDIKLFGYEDRPRELFELDRSEKYNFDFFDIMRE